MTTTLEQSRNEQVALRPSEDQVEVSVNELIVNRKTEFPIYDQNGVLLLAPGSVVTSEIKANLRQRGNGHVLVNPADESRLTLRNQQFSQVEKKLTFDTELTRKLDAVLDNGLLKVKNEGPSVKDDIVFLGRQGYDQQQRKRLINQHEKNGAALSSMIGGALSGELTDGSMVSIMAAEYLKEMTTDTDNVLTSAIDSFQDDDLASRSLEVSLLAMAIGIEMGLDAANCRHLCMAGLVHDWGMMRVPVEIRDAPRRLNPVEMLEIKKHPIYSLEILQHVSALPRIVSVVAYQVHERYNGTGYPRGRCGNSIHQFARILQVADAYMGMISPRPFRPAMMRYAAMECLIRQARDRSVDPDVVRSLLRMQSLFPVGSFVALNDGSLAKVIRSNKDHYTSPIVALVQNSSGEEVDPERDENIIDLLDSDLAVTQSLPTPGKNEISFHEDYYKTSMNQV